MSENTRAFRKTRVGQVVSDKMDKTIVVAIEDSVQHKLYKKIVKQTYKLKAHDEQNAAGIGDTVKVMVKVVEGKTERLQAFEGVVIAKRNGGIRETFTVRRVSYGIGVERTFPVHSPRLGSITIIRHGKVRRAKLYYLRSLQGRAAKIKEVKRV